MVPPGVEGWLHKAQTLFFTGIGSFNPPTMDTSRMVLSKLLMDCQFTHVFLLPIYYRHSRGIITAERVEGSEPMFVVVSEKQLTNKRDLLVEYCNVKQMFLRDRQWYEGFYIRHYTWRYLFYTTLHESDVIPERSQLFDKAIHIKIEGICPTVALIKAVGEGVVDPTKIGHVFMRWVGEKNYSEAFIGVFWDTYIDLAPETLKALNIAYKALTLKGSTELVLTGKNDIEWYVVNKGFETLLEKMNRSSTTGPSTSSTSGPIKVPGKVPGGRGGGKAVGRRASPAKAAISLTSSWKEVVAEGHNQDIRSLQDQIKLLTKEVSSLKLRK
jgi:hypothetical protein